jgi:hypothetical protein
MVEQVRRLRRDSQSRSGRPRVTVRANYVGLPSMAGRGMDEGGESRRIRGEGALSSPRKYGPEAQNRRQWSAERRGILSGMSTPERMSLQVQAGGMRGVNILMRRSALRSPGLVPRKRRQAPRRLTKTRADHAWLFDIVSAQNIPPHPEEPEQ